MLRLCEGRVWRCVLQSTPLVGDVTPQRRGWQSQSGEKKPLFDGCVDWELISGGVC